MTITITAAHLDELFEQLNAVPRHLYGTSNDKLCDKIDECDMLENRLAELNVEMDVLRYDLDKERNTKQNLVNMDLGALRTLEERYAACAEVRDRTAAQLKEALDTIEKSVSLQTYDVVCSALKGTQQRHKEALERIAELELAAAEFDASTDEQNKTRFNIDDVERMRLESHKDGFNAGYEKGKAEQMAEHATELLNRKRHLCDMFEHKYVDLMLKEPSGGWHAPFRFMAHLWASMDVAQRAFPDSPALIGAFASDKLVMVGYNTLTRQIIAVAPENVHDWTPSHRAKVSLAPEPAKD